MPNESSGTGIWTAFIAAIKDFLEVWRIWLWLFFASIIVLFFEEIALIHLDILSKSIAECVKVFAVVSAALFCSAIHADTTLLNALKAIFGLITRKVRPYAEYWIMRKKLRDILRFRSRESLCLVAMHYNFMSQHDKTAAQLPRQVGWDMFYPEDKEPRRTVKELVEQGLLKLSDTDHFYYPVNNVYRCITSLREKDEYIRGVYDDLLELLHVAGVDALDNVPPLYAHTYYDDEILRDLLAKKSASQGKFNQGQKHYR